MKADQERAFAEWMKRPEYPRMFADAHLAGWNAALDAAAQLPGVDEHSWKAILALKGER